jgi:SAM-dependent methyltransferase
MRLYRDRFEPSTLADDVHLSELYLFRNYARAMPFARALSIGCGTGWREVDLIRRGIIQHFTLIEISDYLLGVAKDLAREAGVADRITTHVGDYTDILKDAAPFDLIYWDDALHHMADVEIAIRTTAAALKPDGVFFMSDCVGPSRNQFSDEAIAIAERYRAELLPAQFFAGPDPLSTTLPRMTAAEWIAQDPSEGADSGRILDCLRSILPGVEITLMGGLIYYIAMQSAYAKLDEGNPEHIEVMRRIFDADRALTEARPDLTVYALAAWRKPRARRGVGALVVAGASFMTAAAKALWR